MVFDAGGRRAGGLRLDLAPRAPRGPLKGPAPCRTTDLPQGVAPMAWGLLWSLWPVGLTGSHAPASISSISPAPREVLEWPYTAGGGGGVLLPGPPPPTKVTIVEMKFAKGKILSGHFLVHKVLGPRPPPLSPPSDTSLPPSPPPPEASGPSCSQAVHRETDRHRLSPSLTPLCTCHDTIRDGMAQSPPPPPPQIIDAPWRCLHKCLVTVDMACHARRPTDPCAPASRALRSPALPLPGPRAVLALPGPSAVRGMRPDQAQFRSAGGGRSGVPLTRIASRG